MENVLITGALGFIASNLTNYLSAKYPSARFIILDKLDYCASMENLNTSLTSMGACDKKIEKFDTKKIKVIIGDIANNELVSHILNHYKIDTIIHCAAQTHVSNSFFNSIEFTKTNVLGSHCLLETSRIYYETKGILKAFLHVSTDEIYGCTDDDIPRDENSIMVPTNPYAATKSGIELLVKSYWYSYKFPILIVRCNNVIGPRQYPEKVVPKFITQLLANEKVTIQGQGTARRSFIHVDDVCTAFETILLKGTIGEIYNISSDDSNEYTVKDVALILIDLFGYDPDEYITYVEDRKFNDTRYLITSAKLESLGWKPLKTNFKENLIELIDWYKLNSARFSKP
jgi:dTDP-glucose 4,6-dehydratase